LFTYILYVIYRTRQSWFWWW